METAFFYFPNFHIWKVIYKNAPSLKEKMSSDYFLTFGTSMTMHFIHTTILEICRAIAKETEFSYFSNFHLSIWKVIYENAPSFRKRT